MRDNIPFISAWVYNAIYVSHVVMCIVNQIKYLPSQYIFLNNKNKLHLRGIMNEKRKFILRLQLISIDMNNLLCFQVFYTFYERAAIIFYTCTARYHGKLLITFIRL